MDVSLAAFTISPSSSAFAATAEALSLVNPTPSSSPRPRTSWTSGCPIPRIALLQLHTATGGVLDQAGAFDLTEHGVARGRGQGIAPERAAVLAGGEQVGCGAERDEGTDRHSPANALGDGDRVGNDAVALEGEPVTGATGTRLDLVDNEQCPVQARQLAGSR